MNYAARVDRLRALLDEPLLVTNPTNVFYLTGFTSSNPALLVDDARVQLFTDFRYAQLARTIPDVEFVETKRDIPGDLATRLRGRVGVESASMTYATFQKLGAHGLELVPRAGVVEGLRAVKDEDEVETLQRACEIADRVFEAIPEERFIGRSERELAWRIEELFHEHGGEGLSFPIIVASGPNGSRPHARATDREIGAGELVVIDAGCSVDGYFSDYTRTYATGSVDSDAKDAYTTCLRAQEAALAGIRAGQSGVDADALARAIVDDSPFEGTFGHGLGHGVGLDVHELPRLSTESTETLEPGNAVTVEPGIYVEGRFGIRIEDNVVVTENGVRNLTNLGKDLVSVE